MQRLDSRDNYYCYTKRMAEYLELHGATLVKAYFSQIHNRHVYVFDNSYETWLLAQTYIKNNSR